MSKGLSLIHIFANDGPYGYGPDVLYQGNDVIMQYAQGKHIYPLVSYLA